MKKTRKHPRISKGQPAKIGVAREVSMLRSFSWLLSCCFLMLASNLVLICSETAFADPIDVTSSSVPQFQLGGSADSLQFSGQTTTVDPSSGAPFVFQTGSFTIGDSGSSFVQDVPFSFQEQVTIGGVTKLVTISGDDNVTSTWDTLQIYGMGPLVFGNYLFTLQPFTIADDWAGDVDAVSLDASLTPTPEPGALLLVGTGLAGWGLAAARKARSLRSTRGPQQPSA